MSTRLNWRRQGIAALAGSVGDTYKSEPSKVARVIVPDPAVVTWIPSALRSLHEIRTIDPVACLVTSSPNPSSHMIGLIGTKFRLPWVADFRDGWRFEDMRAPMALGAMRRLDARLESLVVRNATQVTAVSEPIAADFERRFGVIADVVTNGFDPEDFSQIADATQFLDPGKISVVHTGVLGAAGRSIAWITSGVDQAMVRDATIGSKLEIVLAGQLTPDEQREVAKRSSVMKYVGQLERKEALGLQSAADVLLVLAGDDRTSVATGKLYEYLAGRSPIVVIGENTQAAGIVLASGAGGTCSSEPGPVSELISNLASGQLPSRRSSEPPRQFDYASISAKMANVIENAIASDVKENS